MYRFFLQNEKKENVRHDIAVVDYEGHRQNFSRIDSRVR